MQKAFTNKKSQYNITLNMDLEFYKTREHSYFLEGYKDYVRPPNEHEKEFFRPLLKEIVEDISQTAGISDNFKLYFGMTDEITVDEDSPINYFVHGYSFPECMEGFERDVIMVRAVRNKDNWKDCLTNMVAHEMSHQEYYNYCDSLPYTKLENIIFEGHAMNRTEKITERMDIGWEPNYRSNTAPDIDPEAIIDILDDRRTHDSGDIFQKGGELCQDAEGYQIAYLTVKNMLKNTEIDLEQLPEEKPENLRKIVEENLRKTLEE